MCHRHAPHVPQWSMSVARVEHVMCQQTRTHSFANYYYYKSLTAVDSESLMPSRPLALVAPARQRVNAKQPNAAAT